MSTGPRDDAFVQRAQAGDKGAFGELLARHRPLAYRLAWRLLGDAVEAEDVVQEASLQAYLGLNGLRHPERFGAWLAGIALNLGRLRLRARRDAVSLEDWDGGRVAPGFTWAETQPSPEAAAEIRELHGYVLRALEALPAEQQAVVRLHYLDGLTLNEIGVLAGSPLGTVKARLHRAREKLRAQLIRELSMEPAPAPAPPRARSTQERTMIEVIVQDVIVRTQNPEAAPDQKIILLRDQPQDVLEAARAAAPGPAASATQLPHPPEEKLQHRVVLLKEKAGERVLPIWVGPHEGDMLALQLAGQSAPRPLTYELTARLLEAAQARIERLTIARLHEEVFYATLLVRTQAGAQEVDARPSDGLNLALRCQAPIFVDAALLEQAGCAPEALYDKLEKSVSRQPPVVWVSQRAPAFPLPKRAPET